MTEAKAAFGVTLSRAGVAVAEIIEMGNVVFNRELLDVTNHASPGGYEEFIASAVIKTGELTLKCNSVAGDTAQAGIKSDWASGAEAAYAITFPDGMSFAGNAIVTNYEYEVDKGKQIIFGCTLKWTGALTPSTSAVANASNIVLTTANLTPAFAAGTYNYVGVSTGDSCTVTASFSEGTAKLYRNDVYVQDLVTATPSGSINLGSDGDLTTLKVILAVANKASKTYRFDIANAAA